MASISRDELKALSAIRLREANTLLQNSHFDGAYYLSGYVVECALKACIARKTKRFDFPDRQRVNESWTHSLEALLRTADLRDEFDQARRLDNQLDLNWLVVRDWRETSRYEQHDQQEAEGIYRAIADNRHGVLKWLRRHW